MENNNLEQRYAIKFCVKMGEGATDTYEKIMCSSISVGQSQIGDKWWNHNLDDPPL
jgi:hypothetical protein